MSSLVAVVFDDETTAFEMRAALAKMQKEYLIEMEDAVVVTKDMDGKAKLHQAVNLTAAGAVGGGFWGMLIGMIFLNPLIGAAAGAAGGALSGKFTDIGISDKMMQDVAQSFKPGTSALFVLVKKATGDKVLDGLKQFRRQRQGLPDLAQQGRRSGVARRARKGLIRNRDHFARKKALGGYAYGAASCLEGSEPLPEIRRLTPQPAGPGPNIGPSLERRRSSSPRTVGVFLREVSRQHPRSPCIAFRAGRRRKRRFALCSA